MVVLQPWHCRNPEMVQNKGCERRVVIFFGTAAHEESCLNFLDVQIKREKKLRDIRFFKKIGDEAVISSFPTP
jgi:hypothetical protein